MAPQRPGAYDPRPSSRASNRNKNNKNNNTNHTNKNVKAPPKLAAELTAAAISKKTPDWFHISGIPVRPLTARETRRAPPTSSNKGRTLVKPKTQVEIQKEKMVGTSSNNPHYFRLPYKRGQVGQGGEKKETKDDSGGNNIANKQQVNRPPTAPSAGARKPVHKPSPEQILSEEEKINKNAN